MKLQRYLARIGCTALLGILPALAVAQSSPTGPSQASNSNPAQKSSPKSNHPDGTKLSADSSDASSSAPLLLAISRLPSLGNTGVDAQTESKNILAHLNGVLRLYRTATMPIQKVGEPSDVLYAEEAQTEATTIARMAFQSATNEAAWLMKADPRGMAVANSDSDLHHGAAAQSEAQKLAAAHARVTDQLANLQNQSAALNTQLQHAPAAQRAVLQQQQQELTGEIELQQTIVQALERISSSAGLQPQSGLAGDIARLRGSVPELVSSAPPKPVAGPQESLSSTHDSGVTSQAEALFQLLSARRDIETAISINDQLHAQATDLRSPYLTVLRNTLDRGQQLAQQGAADLNSGGKNAETTGQQFNQLTTTLQTLSQAMLPLTQEIMHLEAERSTLTSWDTTVDSEYSSILRSLLVRLCLIAAALGIILVLSWLWGRATVRYVQDMRRRRQLLLVRRIAVGFLGCLIILFGFVTQFSSLATFAGFITAGIAVGLQSILLSVAAYFFIIGRYGVKVGDRITVASVTGDVIEVGLARFYMMELVGSGTAMHTTGRVAVFANSVLFQTGTPLYKQMPGTEYAWHELIAKLNPASDAEAVRNALLQAVNGVYESYRQQIESQHGQVETWIGTAIEAPKVSSRLEMTDAGLQIVVLFPVEIQQAAETDQKIALALLAATAKEGSPLKTGLTATPVINSAIKF